MQFSNHDEDLRHRVRAGSLHQGHKIMQGDAVLTHVDELPESVKHNDLTDHVLCNNAAYDCVENARNRSHVPVLLQ